MSANFNVDTVRLQADAGIEVGQIVTRDLARADSSNPRQADLERQIQALQDQIAPIDADYKGAQLVQAYLERMGSGTDAPEYLAPIDPKSMLGTLGAIRSRG